MATILVRTPLNLSDIEFKPLAGVLYEVNHVQFASALLHKPDRHFVVDTEVPSGPNQRIGIVWNTRYLIVQRYLVEDFAIIRTFNWRIEGAQHFAGVLVRRHVLRHFPNFVGV